MNDTPDLTAPEAVKRYDMAYGGEDTWMGECENGDYVDYDDYAALSAERDEWKAAAQHHHPNLTDFRCWEGRYRDEKARAEAAEAERNQWRKAYYDTHELFAQSDEKRMAAEAERDDAIDTLNAWFDRRELAHDAIDETVLNAARGYLRTSRSGGLDQETSAVIEGVIEDMARLSVFADLFARAFLARHQKETDT